MKQILISTLFVIAFGGGIVGTSPLVSRAQGTPTANGTPIAVFPPANTICDPLLGTPVASSSETDSTSPTPAVVDVATLEFDTLYLDVMIPHHRNAIRQAIIVRERTTRTEIADMATTIATNLQIELDQMLVWRAEWYPDVPRLTDQQLVDGMTVQLSESPGVGGIAGLEEMGAMHALSDLTGLCATADEIELAYIDVVIAQHSSAIVLGQEALSRLVHPELLELATAILNEQAAQIDQLSLWRTDWYPDAPLEDHHGA